MKKIIILLTALSLPLSILCAEKEENDTDQKKIQQPDTQCTQTGHHGQPK
jgi:hypothetical protein